MFHAIRKQQIAANVSERQVLSFYSKADRQKWLAANGGEAIKASEAAALKSAGAQHAVSDKALGMVFFSRIVA